MAPEVGSLDEGAIFDQRFRIEKVVGRGGMGHVVSALHLDLDQRVAIKLLLPDKRSDEKSRQRLLREARASARIKSEHVVRVLDVVSGRDVPSYIVMEYLEGEDLAARLKRQGPQSVGEVVDMIAQACQAIGEAHQLGIVHRDLKPSNLFLTEKAGRDDFAKVLDFGISKSDDHVGDSLTQSHALLGSPIYAAPEQMRSSHDVDHRADIWSLGVILYECTTGQRPFTGPTLGQLCTQILERTPTVPGLVCRDLPQGFESVVMRCLEKKPAERFQSVQELLSALREFRPEAVDRCLAYLAGVRVGQASARPRPVVRSAPHVRSAATLTDSIAYDYDTEVSIDRSRLGRRSRATWGFWATGLVVALAGAWLLGRASSSAVQLSSSSPAIPIHSRLPAGPVPLELSTTPASRPADEPAAPPFTSVASAPKPPARAASPNKPARAKSAVLGAKAAPAERDVTWVESR
ncbi:MAG TPA: protein kinase [Polyangiaceae bacterium]|nr:protein kinase [Polyangiaceae bacterium]